jgi:lysophospholipase L1-like esterase
MSATVTQTGRVATVTVSTARYIHPNHNGDVTSVGDGATTITDKAVTLGKIQDIGSGKVIGRHTAGDGTPQEIGIDGGLEIHGSNIRRAALTGDVTASAGSNATAIADDTVTNAKLANVPTATIKGRTTAGTGDPEDLTVAQVLTMLDLDNLASGVDPRYTDPGAIGRYAFLGDSMTDTTIPTTAWDGKWPGWAIALSRREQNYTPNSTKMTFGAGGKSTRALIDEGFVATLVAATPQPTHCFFMEGANSASAGRTAAQYESDVRELVGLLLADNITPIILSAPSIVADTHLSSTTYRVMAEYSAALVRICQDLGLRYIDNSREIERPDLPGAAYRGFSFEGPSLGLHPDIAWNVRVGLNVADVIFQYGTSALITAATTLQSDNWTTVPTSPGVIGVTHSIGTVLDAQGGATKRLRIRLKQTSKAIGSGDTGFSFTPATGVSLDAFEVVLRRDQSFTNSSVPGQPSIAVVPANTDACPKTIIIVKTETTGFTATNTCSTIISALNAHPIASALFTTASTGTPGSNVPTAAGTTFGTARLNTVVPGVSETMADTDEVRGVVTMYAPIGALVPYLQLRGYDSYGTAGGGGTTRASTPQVVTQSAIGGPLVPVTLYTPWVVASTFRRYFIYLYMGGTNGDYFAWDAIVQRRTP